MDIYMWINISINKRYIGSTVDLSSKLKNYYNIAYLEKETNSSIIYKILLRYGYFNFNLDIIKICELIYLIKRKRYYLYLFKS